MRLISILLLALLLTSCNSNPNSDTAEGSVVDSADATAAGPQDSIEDPYPEGYEELAEVAVAQTLADLQTADGHILNIPGEAEYWYALNGVRYRLEETSAENILGQGIPVFNCTQEQLDSFEVSEKVLDYVPQPYDNVELY